MSATLARMGAAKNLTPEQRKLRASLAAHAQWANESNRTARTAAAKRAAESRFERQVDPDGELDPADRTRRAESARRAHMQSLALRSARKRAKK